MARSTGNDFAPQQAGNLAGELIILLFLNFPKIHGCIFISDRHFTVSMRARCRGQYAARCIPYSLGCTIK